MKTILKLEELALFLLCIFLFYQLNLTWWWFPAFLLLPDIGTIGYLFSTKIGAFTYNITHNRLVASGVALYALTYGGELWKFAAIILFAHISFDRTLGYGLKFTDSFSHTHLGMIGNK